MSPMVLHVLCILICATTVTACGTSDTCRDARNELVDSACYVQGNATIIADYYSSVRAKHHQHGDYDQYYATIRYAIPKLLRCRKQCAGATEDDVTWCVNVWNYDNEVELCLNKSGLTNISAIAEDARIYEHFVLPENCADAETGLNFRTGCLEIKNPQYYLNGAYLTCTTQTETCTMISFYDITVSGYDTEPPALMNTWPKNGQYELTLGQTAILECTVILTGFSAFAGWYQDGVLFEPVTINPRCNPTLQDCYPQDHPTTKQLLAQRKIVLQSVEILDSCPIREIIISSFLKIVNATESDAGVYICSAQHTVLIPSPHVEMSHWNVTAITVSPTCLPNGFQCPTEGNCIPKILVCDGVLNCTHGEDEENCTGSLVVGLYPSELSLHENVGYNFPLHYCVEVLSGEVNRNVTVKVESVTVGFARHDVDYRAFIDSILISPDVEYKISPEGRPLFCTLKYDVVIGDDEVERTDFEYFRLQVVPDGANGIQVADSFRSTAFVFIIDDDFAEIDFEASEYTVREGDGGVVVCVQLVEGHLSWPVSFRLSTVDGSANAGYDYNISGILPQIGGFPFTQHLSVIDTYVSDNWCVFIPIIDDGEMEGNETFTVELFTPSVEVVAIRETACVTIVDNDGTPEVGPLEVFFTEDTPIIRPEEHQIEVLLGSNKPASAICRLIRRRQRTERDCTPGTPVVFANLEAGSYTIRVLAVATETGEKEDSTRPLYIPASSNDCVGNLINHGVSDSEDQGGVVAEFKVSGKYAFLNCKLDGVLLQRQLCSSPVTLSGLTEGDHRLRIEPQQCSGGDDRPLNIDFTV